MKFTVEVTHVELAEMGVSPEQLEVTVKQEIESGMNVYASTLDRNDADVIVVVAN